MTGIIVICSQSNHIAVIKLNVMDLRLFAHTAVKDVKKQFNANFPFLKIEFFRFGHKKNEGSGFEQIVHDKTLLSDITGVIREGAFSVDPTMTVAEFEQKMQNEYGLPVQVFRKSGDLWLETVQTDKLSLGHQNEMGADDVKKVKFNINTLFL
jgi:hypothetical protein